MCFLLLFSGCQEIKKAHIETKKWMKDTGNIKVLCTTAYVGILVRSVGGEYVDVLDLINSQNDPHSYKLVKGDDTKFRRADVVFYSGLGLEQGSTLVRYLSTYKACSIGDGIARTAGGEVFIGPTADPHMWMDISLWAQGAQIIAQALSKIRPDCSEYFQQRASDTIKRLMTIHEKIRVMTLSIPPENRYLVTSHDSFHYFCRAYLATPEEQKNNSWMARCIAPEGFSPESQISTHDLNDVVKYIIEHNVRTVCGESGMNQDSIQKVIEVCSEKGHPITISHDFLYSDIMGPQMTYEETMEHNARVINTALKGR
jgi:manganese/zinc/iron transport system substrate-binding protein